MDILSIIEHKQKKMELSKEEIEYFVNEYTQDRIPDYQASALIMAIYLNGMTKKETANLTIAMANSGDILDLSDISDIIVDKHSTGGVGDKITIILMPIIASLGIPVAKTSGRGLGFTGGTADKLEAIPGYKVDIPIKEFKQNVKEIGISLITTTSNIAPADKKIYALRDTTSCVSNIPLIASSIMSKKIALGANKIVIDVTYGSGAFMKTIPDAIKLAKEMIEIGKNTGIEVRCVLTSMEEPVGYEIGNQLEIIEAIKALQGNMEKGVYEIVCALGTQILIMAKKVNTEKEAKKLIDEAISSGKAFNKFKDLVIRQGGDVSFIENISKFKNAEYIEPIIAKKSGYIVNMKTEEIGKIACFLGAGRETKNDKIDMQAGIVLNKKINDKVKKGETLCYIHTNCKEKIEEATKRLQKAITILSLNKVQQETILKIIK